MASISKNTRGQSYRLRFTSKDRKQVTFSLGKRSKKEARIICDHVSEIEDARKTHDRLDRSTRRWLKESCPDQLGDKLADAGLIPKRQRLTIEAVIDRYIDIKRPDMAANSLMNFHRTKVFLERHFGKDKQVNEIKPKHAEAWRTAMKSATKRNSDGETVRKYADAYISKRIKQTKQIFNHAKKHRWVTQNPFNDLVAGSESNPERQFFVTREMTAKMMNEIPDAETRLVLGLYRFGGLRQMEVFKLRWEDVNFENNVFMVTSPKTKKKKPYRIVPIFPELRPLFEDALELAEKGAEFIVTKHRDAKAPAASIYSKFVKIRKRAGVEPYPKLFHNLRSSRETELLDHFSIKNVCDWIGNDEATAKKHYLQTTDKHVQRAAETPTGDLSIKLSMKYDATDCEQKNELADKHAKNRETLKNTIRRAHKKSPINGAKYTPEDSNL